MIIRILIFAGEKTIVLKAWVAHPRSHTLLRGKAEISGPDWMRNYNVFYPATLPRCDVTIIQMAFVLMRYTSNWLFFQSKMQFLVQSIFGAGWQKGFVDSGLIQCNLSELSLKNECWKWRWLINPVIGKTKRHVSLLGARRDDTGSICHQQRKTFFLKKELFKYKMLRFLLCIRMLCLHTCLYTTCTPVSAEVGRRQQISWSYPYGRWEVTHWVLGIEHKSSAKIVSVHICWATSPAQRETWCA